MQNYAVESGGASDTVNCCHTLLSDKFERWRTANKHERTLAGTATPLEGTEAIGGKAITVTTKDLAAPREDQIAKLQQHSNS